MVLEIFLGGVGVSALAIYVAVRRRKRAECILQHLYMVDSAPGIELVKWHPKVLAHGQINRDLRRLERDGLVVSRMHHEGNGLAPRRIYILTHAGERVAHRLINANQ